MNAIKAGALEPLDRIPSTRDLAALYECHRQTVMVALQTLVAEGWLEALPRAHYAVTSRVPATSSREPGERRRSIEPLLPARGQQVDLEQSRFRLEFWGGQPDLRLFPKDEFRRAIAESLRRAKPEHLSYGFIDGLEPLRKQAADYLRRTRSLAGKDILITSGSQEALTLIIKAFLKPGDTVAVEAKGYPPAWKALQNAGARIVPIPVDAEGLVTADLKKVFKKRKVKLVYTTPLHQYPTTVTLSPRRRQELIDLCESHRVPLLEDDYDHEFHYAGPPPAPLSTETDCGIYICSFSKLLFPGARLGLIACHPNIKAALVQQKFLHTRQTEALSQLALAHWIREGGFERHLRRTRRIYEKRLGVLSESLEAMKDRFKLEWHRPAGGMSIWLDLKRDSGRVVDAAKRQGVLFQAEKGFDFQNRPGTHLRIGFAAVNEAEIREGMAVLGRILD